MSISNGLHNRTVLITGGTGSVCMNISERLLDEGLNVVVFARRPLEEADYNELANRKGHFSVFLGDILDESKLDEAVTKYQVTDIIHGAAMTPSIQMEREQAKQILEVNCIGVLNAVKAAQKHDIGRFIYLGSISAYGKTAFEGNPLVEGVSAHKPTTFYEITKHAGERIVLRYRQLFEMDAYVARIGDVFGPWEHYSGVRPSMSFPFQTTRSAILGEPVYLPRACELDWVYGKDIANSILALLASETLEHEIYPLCSGHIWSMLDWCALLKKRYPKFEFGLASDKNTATVSINHPNDNAPMSTELLVKDTGYKPKYGLNESFEDYMQWLDKHPDYLFRND